MPAFAIPREPDKAHAANPLQPPFPALAARSETLSGAQRGPIRPVRTTGRAETVVMAEEVFWAA